MKKSLLILAFLTVLPVLGTKALAEQCDASSLVGFDLNNGSGIKACTNDPACPTGYECCVFGADTDLGNLIENVNLALCAKSPYSEANSAGDYTGNGWLIPAMNGVGFSFDLGNDPEVYAAPKCAGAGESTDPDALYFDYHTKCEVGDVAWLINSALEADIGYCIRDEDMPRQCCKSDGVDCSGYENEDTVCCNYYSSPSISCNETAPDNFQCTNCVTAVDQLCDDSTNVCCGDDGSGNPLRCLPSYIKDGDDENRCFVVPTGSCSSGGGTLKLKVGDRCSDASQCASSNCGLASGTSGQKTCLPREGSCSGPGASACECGAGKECKDPSGGTNYTCEDCGASCPAGPQCTAVSNGDLCPNGSIDCCPDNNPYNLSCIGGTCQPGSSSECLGSSCCEGMVGYKCEEGECVVDDSGNCDANSQADVGTYSGPPVVLDELLAAIFKVLYPLGIFIGMAMIIKSGYALMTSQGEPNAVKSAQEELTSALLGILFIMLSITILRVIINSLVGGASF